MDSSKPSVVQIKRASKQDLLGYAGEFSIEVVHQYITNKRNNHDD